MSSTAPLSSPGIRFPPPLLFLGGILFGWLIDWRWHALPLSAVHAAPLAALGGLLVGLGVVLALWGVATFRGAKTAIVPFHPASQLVTSGPYRFTRNPMYTGMTLVHLGASALLNSAWPLILLPVALLVVRLRVMAREEAYLAGAFGAEYDAYKARVRRWL